MICKYVRMDASIIVEKEIQQKKKKKKGNIEALILVSVRDGERVVVDVV